MDEVGALRGASLCTRIQRKRWGANGWLKARTKRGAGSARRVRIQILSGKMFPLSVRYIAGRAQQPEAEFWRLGTTEERTVHRCEDPRAWILEIPPWLTRAVFGLLFYFSLF